MKKILVALAGCTLLFCGSALGQVHKKFNIKNDTRQILWVAFGHSDRDLTSKMYIISPGKTMKMNDWDVSSDTYIFVHEPAYYSAYYKSETATPKAPLFSGFRYFVSNGVAIDVKYSSRDGLRSNSIFLSNGKIFVYTTNNIWEIVSKGWAHAKVDSLTMDSDYKVYETD